MPPHATILIPLSRRRRCLARGEWCRAMTRSRKRRLASSARQRECFAPSSDLGRARFHRPGIPSVLQRACPDLWGRLRTCSSCMLVLCFSRSRLSRSCRRARPYTASADTPAQLSTLCRASLLRVLRAHTLNRVGTDTLEVPRGPRRQAAKVKTREPFTLQIRACRRKPGGFVTEIVSLVYFDRGRIQPSVRFRTDFQLQGAYEGV